jgi:hypothetical protein
MTKPNCFRTTFAAALLFALSLSGCADQPAQNGLTYGGAVVRVYSQLPPSNIASVTVTITGEGISPPIVVPLTKVGEQWTVNISEIPAGANRTFTLYARDAAGTVLYSGVATGVTIAAGQTASVSISGQEANPAPGTGNASPVVDALVASSIAVTPGATVSLMVNAHDPDVGDTLSYLWSSPSGAFDVADTASTNWAAPETEGTYQITLQVQDDHQAQTTMSVAIAVRAETDAGATATISVTLNNWPVVTAVTSTKGRIDVTESTTLDVVASDADGDTLTYAWTADSGCAGTFVAANVKSPTFTLGATPPESGTCAFTVTVDDGRGGTNTGTLTIAAAPAPAVNLAPVITSATQSVTSTTASQTVTFSVQAVDPEATAVSFAWTATSGTLGTPTETTGSSQVVWTAPSPMVESYVRITVSDATGVTTTRTFTVFATIGSTATATSTSTATGVDTTAPTVSALVLSTSTDTSTTTSLTVDTSSGPATVAVSFTVTDDLSGIAQVRVELESQSGAQVRMCYVTTPADAPAPLTLGSSCNLTFPQHSEAGTWQVKLLTITDAAGNSANLAASNLAAYTTTLTMVASTVDTSAPTLTAFSFTPTSVNATGATAYVTVTATITDNLSGFDYAGFMFADPTEAQWQSCWMYRPAGSSGLRVFSSTCTVEIPRYSNRGQWTVVEVDLGDEASNEIRLTTADLSGHFPVALTVTSDNADIAPPDVTAFSLTPSSIDTATGSVTVTASVTATDNPAGIIQMGVQVSSPSGTQSRICYYFSPNGTSPTELAASCSLVIPRYCEAGEWKVDWMYVVDSAWNIAWFENADLAAHEGFATSLTVTSSP